MLSTLFVLFIASVTSLTFDLSQKQLVDSLWENYKQKHQLTFSLEEEEIRRDVFVDSLELINEHNELDSTFKLGITKFAHMTYAEYLDFLKRSEMTIPKTTSRYNRKDQTFNVIEDIDWRTKGAVTEVKNQMHCRASWAFSAVGALEGQLFLKTKKLVSLSEMDLIDCSYEYGSKGCAGGFMHQAFDYVRDHGINSEKDYPYEPRPHKCFHNDSSSVLKMKEYKLFNDTNETHLASLLSNIGPISVGYDASDPKIRLYKEGVFISTTCSSKHLNHGMILVGLGSKPIPHYIVKNSWGTDFGVNGYLLTARDRKNMCGISSYYTYPILE